MLNKEISYADFNGVEKKITFHFHLSEADLVRRELEYNGSWSEHIQKIVDAKDGREIIELFDDILRWSYGVKSADGQEFNRSDAIFEKFKNHAAFSDFFMELVTDADAASAFTNSLVSPETRARVDKKVQLERERLAAEEANGRVMSEAEARSRAAVQDRLPGRRAATPDTGYVVTAEDPIVNEDGRVLATVDDNTLPPTSSPVPRPRFDPNTGQPIVYADEQ